MNLEKNGRGFKSLIFHTFSVIFLCRYPVTARDPRMVNVPSHTCLRTFPSTIHSTTSKKLPLMSFFLYLHGLAATPSKMDVHLFSPSCHFLLTIISFHPLLYIRVRSFDPRIPFLLQRHNFFLPNKKSPLITNQKKMKMVKEAIRNLKKILHMSYLNPAILFFINT